MAHQQFQSCIDACNECAVTCNHCASACLQERDVQSMARCIALDMECADICRLAVSSMARRDEHMQAICALCADICQACGDECAKLCDGLNRADLVIGEHDSDEYRVRTDGCAHVVNTNDAIVVNRQTCHFPTAFLQCLADAAHR